MPKKRARSKTSGKQAVNKNPENAFKSIMANSAVPMGKFSDISTKNLMGGSSSTKKRKKSRK